MRVELNKSNKRVSFIWGEGHDIPEGQVVVRWIDFDLGRGADKAETFTIPHARIYWGHLVRTGFKVYPVAT